MLYFTYVVFLKVNIFNLTHNGMCMYFYFILKNCLPFFSPSNKDSNLNHSFGSQMLNCFIFFTFSFLMYTLLLGNFDIDYIINKNVENFKKNKIEGKNEIKKKSIC